MRLQLRGGTTADGSPAPRPLPGMSAVAALRVAVERDVVSVPVSSVFRDGEQDAVWFVEQGVAEKRTVVLGAQGEDYVQVVEGLQIGDEVVTRGADQVSEGDEVP